MVICFAILNCFSRKIDHRKVLFKRSKHNKFATSKKLSDKFNYFEGKKIVDEKRNKQKLVEEYLKVLPFW